MKKSTKTKMLTVSAIMLFAIICFGWYLTDDEPLKPEAAQWIADASKFEENDAYYLLLGMPTGADEDPIAVGKQVYQFYKDKSPLWYSKGAADDFQFKTKLSLPELDGFFCSMKESECWQYIFANTNGIPEAVQPYSIVKERYQRFIQSKDYHTNLISIPAMPNYSLLIRGNKIVLLQAIDQAKTNPQLAIKSIQTDLANLREQLKNADYILLKLIINAMVAYDVQAMTLLTEKYGITSKIPRLSTDEKSLDKPFKFELAFVDSGMRHFGDDVESQNDFVRRIKQLELHFLYNGNMTMNSYLRHFQLLRQVKNLAYAQVIAFLDARKETPQFFIKNFMGRARVSEDEFKTTEFNTTFVGYLTRPYDTDLKIMLFNEIQQQKAKGEIDLTKIQNPYFTSPTHPYWSKDGKQICLDKPVLGDQDNQQDSENTKVCLIVKL